MKIEIWSDFMCPFCYLGKRRFEEALKQFPHRDNVQVQWKSYQLAPDLKTDTSKNVHGYLADKKGWTMDQAKKVNRQMAATAKEAGLEYDFDKAIPANTFNAHRLSHLAVKYQLQDAAEEGLFSAYFTEGKNIDDTETLVQLGTRIGLNPNEVRSTLKGDDYSNDVEIDEYEARQISVTGVPFFVVDNKYAVSGAQSIALFLEVLQKAWKDKENGEPAVSNIESATCAIDEN